MATLDYENELASLRRSYIEATPKQRLSVAWQRIRYPEHGPNVLVACVSAVEGFARCLLMHAHASAKTDLAALYPRYRFKSAEELITEYLSKFGLGSPEGYFGTDTWTHFHFAVEYRNLLAHECTYIGQDRSPLLVDACLNVLRKLAATRVLGNDEA